MAWGNGFTWSDTCSLTERPRDADSVTVSRDPRRPLTLRAGLFALLLSALWGGNPVAIKAGLEDAPPLRLGWLRFVVGGVVVLAWALATRRSLRIARHEWRPLLFLGCLFAVQIAFMNIGQDFTSAGHAVVITTTSPLWTSVIAHFYVPGDRLSKGRFLGAMVAYSGIVVLFSRGIGNPSEFLLGDFLMLISAILLGARQVYLSNFSQGIEPQKLLLSQSVVGTVAFVLASFFVEPDPYNWTGRLIVALLYQGAVIAGFGFIGSVWLLQRYLPSRVTVIWIIQPAFGVLLGWLVLGETVGPELYAGAALIIVGSYMAQRLGSTSAG